VAFSGNQKTRLGLSGFPRTPVTFTAKTAEALVVIPGLEYTVDVSRLHFSTDVNRLHYKVSEE